VVIPLGVPREDGRYLGLDLLPSLGPFESVVAVAFQSAFCAEMHQNDVFFLFLKIIFKISALKRSKTYKKN
jgi:hypothetical protein